MVSLLMIAATLALAPPGPSAQGPEAGPRTRTTTLAALTAYPLFFHLHRVRVQAEASVDAQTGTAWLSDGTHRIALTGAEDRASAGGRVQVTGSFWDLGRLQPDDARLSGQDYRELSRHVLGRDWPGPGELLLIAVEATAAPEAPAEPTVRAIALDPTTYDGKRVTLVGRFRGANLYGDLPTGPGKSKWDFVLQSADAAIWITVVRPRGQGFDLSPQARVDTGRWLRVAGVVRHEGALAWIEGQMVELADAPQETPEEPVVVRVPVQVPPPTVVFSAPVRDDTDVTAKSDVRIQFSRDMDPASFEDRVRVSYFGGAPDPPAPPVFTFDYRAGSRVLEIRFTAPLERFRTVRVELLEGITASDGAPLEPWTLSFSVGAQ